MSPDKKMNPKPYPPYEEELMVAAEPMEACRLRMVPHLMANAARLLKKTPHPYGGFVHFLYICRRIMTKKERKML